MEKNKIHPKETSWLILFILIIVALTGASILKYLPESDGYDHSVYITQPRGNKEEKPLVLEGIASWIRYELPDSCACRDFPKGTRLEIKMVNTEEPTVICTVRDYIEHPNRIIDLNYDQFKQLASPKIGLINVSIKKAAPTF